jgi:molybdate transport system ATP-binding protein
VADLAFQLAVARGDFSLEVEETCPPGITCIIGPSGSGKSTLLAVLAGLAAPDRGRVAIGDEVWLDRARGIEVPVHRRRLSYVFQGLALFPHMSALHNVEYGLHDLPRAEREERALKLLERVGVKHLAKRRPRTFSGGEAQRVAIARALARSPRLVLLDEPFSALDRDLRAQLTALVRDLAGELGVPIVHVTHSIAEVRLLADHVLRIEKGRVVARGKPADVLAGVTD